MVAIVSEYSEPVAFTVSDTSFEGVEVDLFDPEDLVTGDDFGFSVSISGDGQTIAVGAPGSEDRGAVYLFSRKAGSWVREAKIYAPASVEGFLTGYEVALDHLGKTLAMSVPGWVENGVDCGAVFVYTRTISGWNQIPRLMPASADRLEAQRFGAAMSMSSDGTKIVAAGLKGKVLVFSRTSDTFSAGVSIHTLGTLTLTPSLAASNDGSFIVLGNPNENSARGGATVFSLDDGSYVSQALTPSDTSANGNFGSAVGISGDGVQVFVGAPGETSARGALYLYTRSGQNYTESSRFFPIDGEAGDRFGESISASRDGARILVGSPMDQRSLLRPGSAYYLSRSGTSLSQSSKLEPANADGSRFGVSVSMNAGGSFGVVGGHKENQAGTVRLFN